MNRYSGLIGGALLALGLSSPTMDARAAGSTGAGDKARIEALEQRFADAFNARDLDGVMKVYAPGSDLFVFDLTPPRQHVGWNDYREDWRQLFAAFPGPIHFSISDLSVAAVGPVGYGHSIQTVNFTRKDGSPLTVVARVTDVYRKIHGRWYIVEEHVSVPVDLDSGKADLLSKP